MIDIYVALSRLFKNMKRITADKINVNDLAYS